jgi:DMSO/TMAO reductase YedYZ molybdopterin-dependent catalytic subunit
VDRRTGSGQLQEAGSFRDAALTPAQIADSRSLLALKVNGADLSMDHGFPARIIVPALPGVHNTKWVASLTFRSA